MKRKIWNVILVALAILAINCLAFGVAACTAVQKPGADGASAYEAWLENGNEGTEKDFLEWLKGEDGTDGKDGQDGTDGKDGQNGIDGESAFDIWKRLHGNENSTEEDFLEWLKGEDGKDGEDLTAHEHTYTEWVAVLEPTCTSIGYSAHECIICGYVEYDFAKATGHVWNDGFVLQATTCGEEGIILYACTVCGTAKMESLSITGHDYSVTVIDPTCTAQGYSIYKCEVCGDEYIDDYLDMLGHNLVALEINTNDEAAGSMEGTYCLNCNEITLKAVNNVGYTFVGWFEEKNLISEELTYIYKYCLTGDELPIFTAEWTYYTLTVISDMLDDEGYFVVYFDYNDESGKVDTQFISKTESLVYPAIPTRTGHVFRGWFKDKACTDLFDFSANVTANITIYAGWEQMVDENYSSRMILDIVNSYNTENRAYNTTISNYNYYYYYFTALTSGSYTIYYKNNSSASAYRIYTYIYNQTQDSVIKSNSLIGSKDYYSYSFTVNAGDVIYIRVQRQDYNTWTPNFYCYVTGGETPADGGIMDGSSTFSEVKVTANQEVTLSAVSYERYMFLGWYDGDILISTDLNYTFYMPKENLTYTAKYAKN